MSQEPLIRISVRNLVEFVLQEGDIDNRKARPSEKETMQLGSRIHRSIQRRMGSAYHAEVSLKEQFSCDGFVLQLEGRADGIFEKEGTIYIDEIKGILRSLDKVEKPLEVHLAQAKCYAYIYGHQNAREEIGVQMTYCHMETEEVKHFAEVYSMTELQDWFTDLVNEYEKWAKFEIEWRKQRNASIKKVEFPYEYREGQKRVATSVYTAIRRKKKLFIQAPTGVGKTIATIFPAVKAVGEELGEKIFYLTAKTITRTVAEQAYRLLAERGLQYKVLTLTAKEKICFCEEVNCNPDACPYAKGHYDRVNDAVYDIITSECHISREKVEEYAKKHQVCPFEMSLDVSLWIDTIICDYNYVFDPRAQLKRFFSEGKKGEYLFLVDEAHNLVERGREMYSATLYKEEFLTISKKLKPFHTKLAKRVEACNKALLEMKRECENYQLHESISGFILKLMNVQSGLESLMEDEEKLEDDVLEFYFHVRDFLNIYDRVDDNYVIYTEFEQTGGFKMKLFCVNPAENLKECLEKGNSSIFFSATFLPIQYYKKLLGADEEDYAIYIDSPFDVRNRRILIGTDISSKYTMRGPNTYRRYAEYILNIVKVKSGNYMVYFPSYQFMEDVYDSFKEQELHMLGIVKQVANMNEEDREVFLHQFEDASNKNLVGFCVMGGVFSEGIDLTDERLIGSIIVGTGLPQVCNEREILKNYFDGQNMAGFDYAYLFPGVNKVLQAAGRVIRTEKDKGVITLLDQRFMGRSYAEIFPREWSDRECCDVENLTEKLNLFWKGAI